MKHTQQLITVLKEDSNTLNRLRVQINDHPETRVNFDRYHELMTAYRAPPVLNPVNEEMSDLEVVTNHKVMKRKNARCPFPGIRVAVNLEGEDDDPPHLVVFIVESKGYSWRSNGISPVAPNALGETAQLSCTIGIKENTRKKRRILEVLNDDDNYIVCDHEYYAQWFEPETIHLPFKVKFPPNTVPTKWCHKEPPNDDGIMEVNAVGYKFPLVLVRNNEPVVEGDDEDSEGFVNFD